MDSSELLKRLRDAVYRKEEKVPPGWFTVEQVAREQKFSTQFIYRIFRRAIKAGILEQKQFRIVNGNRGIYPVWHYREVVQHKQPRSGRRGDR